MTRPAPADAAVRDRVVRDFDTTFLLEAGAGTGKTTVLVSRILALVRSGRATLDRIVAITFTEKAAGELKLRLRDEIEKALETSGDESERARLLDATRDLERAPVSTIHAFTAALLRERPFEAGLDPGFAVAADIAGERVLEDTWDAWFDARMSAADPTLVRAFTLQLKVEDLRKAGRAMASQRDILGRPEPRPPFNPAAFRDRVRESLTTLKPLKKSCTDEEDDAYQQVLRLEVFLARAERADGLALERLLRELDVDANKGRQPNWSPAQACKDTKAGLKSLKDAQTTYRQTSDADLAWALRDTLRGFLDAYEQAKRERAVVDFADLLLKARDVLEREPAVRRYFQRRFDSILIDEFQDTDPLQAQIALLLAEDPEAEPPATTWKDVRLKPGKLFVVGDPKQSIYRFRRADIAIYDEVKRLIEASGGEVLPLTANFRTVPSVLEFVNERFKAVFSEEGDPQPIPLDPYRSETS
jgi:ATP-dependent exoDNAse (exonuclease V) beta subunit